MWRDVGIVGIGAYLPDFRIPAKCIAEVWGMNVDQTGTKTVPNNDEDAVTMAVEAARLALTNSGITSSQIGSVLIGTESKPYAAKPVAATVAAAIGATPWISAADVEFACRGGVAGMMAIAAGVESKQFQYGLLVAVDTAQGRPGNQLESTSGAGAVAFVLGQVSSSVALLSNAVSYVTDTADFFRRDGAEFPVHTNRFTGTPSYFEHVERACVKFLSQTGAKTGDFRIAIFHQPNLKFPYEVANRLGFTRQQLEPGLLFHEIGNTYAAGTLLSLAKALELLESDQQVIVTSYGSGAGADCFAVKAVSNCRHAGSTFVKAPHPPCSLQHYGEYLRLTRQLEVDPL